LIVPGYFHARLSALNFCREPRSGGKVQRRNPIISRALPARLEAGAPAIPR
jgi:hypothetical protein